MHVIVVRQERPETYTFLFFFFNDTATTEIYTLSLHDALPISDTSATSRLVAPPVTGAVVFALFGSLTLASASDIRDKAHTDRKSTRLNSSHANISYAVFCLKKKTNHAHITFAISLMHITSPTT